MVEKIFESETELIDYISNIYGKWFFENILDKKIKREKEAWELLNKNLGKLTRDVIEEIFDKVDLTEDGGKWWGQLLAKPNRNRIFETPTDKLNKWFDYLLNGEEPDLVRIEKCIEGPDYKVKGAGKGLVTLLLYLKDPESYNVMMNTTIDGLAKLKRFSNDTKLPWRDYYKEFNESTKQFRDEYGLNSHAVDWVLTQISDYIEPKGDNFSTS